MKTLNERMTVVRDEPIVVFLIGMRVNRWWKVHRWLLVSRAMPRMLRELFANEASGLLGATFGLTSQGPFMVQYWESTEKLMSYASDRSGQHFPAWPRSTAASAPAATSASGTRPMQCRAVRTRPFT